MPEKRVLVIDDNPINLKITCAVIRRAGFITHESESAEAGLLALEHELPDLIVTDLNLPGMNGIQFTRKVKQVALWKAIPIVLLTASELLSDRALAEEAGCECLLPKPIDTKLFPGVIRSYLGEVPVGPDQPEGPSIPLGDLRREFLAAGVAECRRLIAEASMNRSLVGAVDYPSIRSAVHRWSGVGGTLGFPTITTKSRALNAALASPTEDTPGQVRQMMHDLLEQFTHARPIEVVASSRRVYPAGRGIRVEAADASGAGGG